MSNLSLQRNKRGRLCTNMRYNLPFGIFTIDKNKLQRNILSICRRTTNKKIGGFANQKISDELKSVILELIQGVRSERIEELPADEEEFINKIITRSGVTGLKAPQVTYTDKELQNKLSVNLGELKSGNDSKSMKLETKQILNVLSKKGYFNEYQVNHISKSFKL